MTFWLFLQYNPKGLSTHKMKRKLKRDRRRWIHADLDATETLNKTEFKHFLFPKIGLVWVPEFHEDLDNDYDGFVSQKEFQSMRESDEKLTTYFKDLDKDRNGLLGNLDTLRCFGTLWYPNANCIFRYLGNIPMGESGLLRSCQNRSHFPHGEIGYGYLQISVFT